MSTKDNKAGDFQEINPEDYSDFEEKFIKKGGSGGTPPSKKGARTIRALKKQGKESGQDDRRKDAAKKLTRVLDEISSGDISNLGEYLDWLELHLRESYSLDPNEVEISFARSGGPGGQNVNRRETKVTLVHKQTKLRVSSEDTRSQAKNRQIAQERLRQRLQDHLDDWRTYLEPGEQVDLDLIQKIKEQKR